MARNKGPGVSSPWPDNWVARAAQVVLCVGHVLTVLTGLAYVVAPSVSVEKLLDPAWSISWSSIFVVFGFGCLVFRIKKLWMAEAICMFCVAAGIALWGAMLVYATTEAETYGALQVGIRLISGAVLLAGFALLELEWVILRSRPTPAMVETILNKVSEEMRRRDTGG